MQIRLATHSDAKCTRSRLGLCNNVGKAVYANQPLRTTTVSFFIRIVDGKLGLKSISNKKNTASSQGTPTKWPSVVFIESIRWTPSAGVERWLDLCRNESGEGRRGKRLAARNSSIGLRLAVTNGPSDARQVSPTWKTRYNSVSTALYRSESHDEAFETMATREKPAMPIEEEQKKTLIKTSPRSKLADPYSKQGPSAKGREDD